MTQQSPKGSARALADVSEGLILATVDIAAPIARVFAALTAADEIPRWWGSDETYRTKEWISDFHVGGRWRATGVNADGSPYIVTGEYLQIEAPYKIVHTWDPDWESGHVTMVSYRLEEIPGGTRLTVRHDGFAGREESCRMHTEGWEQIVGWLRDYLVPAAVEPSSYYLFRLISPRPTFPADMTPREAEVMQAHVGYWTQQMSAGKVVVFGPVLDPKGVWGLGVIRAANDAEAKGFGDGDPTIRSGLGFGFDVLPMPHTIVP